MYRNKVFKLAVPVLAGILLVGSVRGSSLCEAKADGAGDGSIQSSLMHTEIAFNAEESAPQDDMYTEDPAGPLAERHVLQIAAEAVDHLGLISKDDNIQKISALFSATPLDKEPKWYISYYLENAPPPYVFMAIDPVSGEVLEYGTDNYTQYKSKWKTAIGDVWAWSVNDLYLFHQLFTANRSYGARLPGAEHISIEDATEIAHRTVSREFNVSAAVLSNYHTAHSFVDGIIKDNLSGCVWIISFYQKNAVKDLPDYQVNIEAAEGEVVLVYPDPNSLG